METPDPAAVELAAAHFIELATLVRLGSARILMSRSPDGGLRPTGPGTQPPVNWIDDDRAQQLYNGLRELEIEVYCEGLLRAVRPEESRRKVLVAAIRIGRSYSEADLVRLLRRYGTRAICSDYLNCQSRYLADEAADWARRNGFVVRTFSFGKAATWGAF